MTPAEARAHCEKALASALPYCFVPVSQQALRLVLEQLPPPEEPDAHD